MGYFCFLLNAGWMAAWQPSCQNLWGMLLTSRCSCALNNNCRMRQRNPQKRKELCLHAKQCTGMHASVHNNKSRQNHVLLCVRTRAHYYAEFTSCKSTKYSKTFTQRSLWGRKKRAEGARAEKNETSHSEAVKIQYLHQHAPQHHHPLERQLASFHPNSSLFFFSVTVDTQNTESTQSSFSSRCTPPTSWLFSWSQVTRLKNMTRRSLEILDFFSELLSWKSFLFFFFF